MFFFLRDPWESQSFYTQKPLPWGQETNINVLVLSHALCVSKTLYVELFASRDRET